MGTTPKYQYVDDQNAVVSTGDKFEAAKYENMGYRQASPADISADQIRQKYSGAWNTAAAFGVGAVSAVPGALPLATYATDAIAGNPNGTAATWVGGLEQAHPTAALLGETAGSVAAYTTGEGLLTKAGLEGAGLVAQATRSGIVNSLLGYGKKEDNLLLQHAISPGGDEHVFADIGLDDAMNAAIGAAIPVGMKGVSKAAGYLGKAGDALAAVKDKNAILDIQKVNEGLELGRRERVIQTFESKGYSGKSAHEVRADIKARMPDLEAQYNDIKDSATVPLDAASQTILGQTIERRFVGDAAGKGDDILDTIRGEQLSLKDLHGLRQSIDKRIDYKSTAEPDYTQRALWETRADISRAMHMTLEANDALTNQARSPQWKAIDSEYSHLKQIDAIIGEPTKPWKLPGFEDVLPPEMEAEAKMLNKILNYKTLGSYKALGTAMTFAQRMQNEGYGFAARGLGKVFNKQAQNWSKAVAAGLYGVPEAASQYVQAKHQHEDFDALVAKSRWVMNNPVNASANAHTYLANMGADPDTSTKMVGKLVSVNSYLQAQIPTGDEPGVIPQHTYMPEQMKREWVSQYNTAHDPINALVDPSDANLSLARQFYPEWYAKTSQAIVEQVQNNPNLPLNSRIFAAKFLDMPVDGLTSPEMWEMIQMGRAEQQQQAQQSAQQGGRAGSKGSGAQNSAGVNSDSTQLQHLQGEQDA